MSNGIQNGNQSINKKVARFASTNPAQSSCVPVLTNNDNGKLLFKSYE